MSFSGISILLVYITFISKYNTAELLNGYYGYGQEGNIKEHVAAEIEQQLRSVSSVDELMKMVYPKYWTMLRCRSKRGPHFSLRDSSTEQPLTFAAAFFNTDILNSIESEWRKALCMPREVCIDVGRELGVATDVFYKPRCVSVYRCGGCCNREELQCRNISTSYISKTLFEITTPVTKGTKPVTISFANHTLCHCLSKAGVDRQMHSIIRRSLPECNVANKTCPKNHSWNSHLCSCVVEHNTVLSQRSKQQSIHTDICGPEKYLDEDRCQCACKRALSCGPNRQLDEHSCQCVCKAPPAPCGPDETFNKDTCRCTCAKVCPKHQPLNHRKCSCECAQSPSTCFLRGRRFQQATCSCYHPPCKIQKKRCEEGFYFSEEVCRCIPTYWRDDGIQG